MSPAEFRKIRVPELQVEVKALPDLVLELVAADPQHQRLPGLRHLECVMQIDRSLRQEGHKRPYPLRLEDVGIIRAIVDVARNV